MAITGASLKCCHASVKATQFIIGVISQIQKYITDICGLVSCSETTSPFTKQLRGNDLKNVHEKVLEKRCTPELSTSDSAKIMRQAAIQFVFDSKDNVTKQTTFKLAAD
jgi:hypothetical protein